MHLRIPILLTTLLVAAQTYAIDFISTNSYVVDRSQIVDEEQWISADTVEAEGTFRNDLYIYSATNLLLGGTYEGNVWGIDGREVNMKGECRRNLKLLSGTVRISGTVQGNVMVMANTVILTTNAVVEGDMKLCGHSIVLEGAIKGDVSLLASRVVTLGGTISGNVEATSPDIVFARDARIHGDLDYTANKELFPVAGIVEGTLQRIVPKPKPAFSVIKIRTHIMWFFAALLAGFLFMTVFPMKTALATQLVRTIPGKCLFVGFLSSLLLPLFGLLCIFSLVGFPLGALFLGFWAMLIYLSRVVVAIVIGSAILRLGRKPLPRAIWSLVIGMAVIYIGLILPQMGAAVAVMVIWVGMGALVIGIFQRKQLVFQVSQTPEDLAESKSLEKTEKKEDVP